MRMIYAEGLIEYLKEKHCKDCHRGFGTDWCKRTCMVIDVLKDIEKYTADNKISRNEAMMNALN